MKNNNILLLMSKFAATQQGDANAALSSVANCSGESSEALPPLPSLPPAILDLMPSCSALATAAVAVGLAANGEPDTSARLFGISIGLKRTRDDGDAAGAADEDQADDHGAEVKTEPADPRADSKEQCSSTSSSRPASLQLLLVVRRRRSNRSAGGGPHGGARVGGPPALRRRRRLPERRRLRWPGGTGVRRRRPGGTRAGSASAAASRAAAVGKPRRRRLDWPLRKTMA